MSSHPPPSWKFGRKLNLHPPPPLPSAEKRNSNYENCGSEVSKETAINYTKAPFIFYFSKQVSFSTLLWNLKNEKKQSMFQSHTFWCFVDVYVRESVIHVFHIHNARNLADIFFILFSTVIALFSLIVYLVRFNTNNQNHFLTYVLARVSNFTTCIYFTTVLIYLIILIIF